MLAASMMLALRMLENSDDKTWRLEAARLGDADAQDSLGASLSLRGVSLKKDNPEAIRWFALAAAQGHRKAAATLKVLEAQVQADWTRAYAEAIANARPTLTRECQLIYVNGIETDIDKHNMTLNLLRFIFNMDDFRGQVKVDGVHVDKSFWGAAVDGTKYNLVSDESAAVQSRASY